MSIGIFTDKNYRPTDGEISETIGAMLPIWNVFVKHISENHNTQEDFKFLYGKKYGWALRFQIKGKLLISLYPTQNGFVTQINLSPSAIEMAQKIKLDKNARQAINKAYPYPEGKWLFITTESENDIKDIQRLLVLRSETLEQGKNKSNKKTEQNHLVGKKYSCTLKPVNLHVTSLFSTCGKQVDFR